MAATDSFLKIDGIAGESTDDRHRGELEVTSWSFGVSNAATLSPGGAGVGKPMFRDFHFTKETAASSIALMLACASGQRFKTATLTLRKAGAQPIEFMTVVLGNVAVTSYDDSGASGSTTPPQDAFSLNYGRIEIHAKAQKPDGSIGGETVGGWDLLANRKT